MERHLLGHIEGVWVSRSEDLERLMLRVSRRCGFNVVAKAFHQFEPQGTTGVLVLAESHFSAHTYPEKNMIYIDVFCCAKNFDPEFCGRVIEEEFSAHKATWQTIYR